MFVAKTIILYFKLYAEVKRKLVYYCLESLKIVD